MQLCVSTCSRTAEVIKVLNVQGMDKVNILEIRAVDVWRTWEIWVLRTLHLAHNSYCTDCEDVNFVKTGCWQVIRRDLGTSWINSGNVQNCSCTYFQEDSSPHCFFDLLCAVSLLLLKQPHPSASPKHLCSSTWARKIFSTMDDHPLTLYIRMLKKLPPFLCLPMKLSITGPRIINYGNPKFY